VTGKIPLPATLSFKEPTELKIESDQHTVKLLDPKPVIRPQQQGVPFYPMEVAFQADTEFTDEKSTATITAYRGKEAIEGAVFYLTLEPSLPAQFRSIQANAYALAIPIGWMSTGTSYDVKNGLIFPHTATEVGNRLLQHIVGWLLTALAATLGAPFWFDMLNRIISIRSSGKAPEERPKPPKEVSVPVEPGQSHREADRLDHRVS
jgi:hypothetical protein